MELGLEPLLELELSPVQKKTARPKAPAGANPLKPKSRRLPADERRARHRDRMQRQRLAEKQSIELKRVEVERLTRELEQAIARLSGQLKSLRDEGDARGVETFPSLEEERKYLSLVEEEEEDARAWKGQSTAARLIQRRYLSLVLQQETITEENRRLTERFREWQRFMKLLGVEHERLPKYGALEADEAMMQHGGAGGEGRWVVFSEDEPVIFYQPLATDACHDLAFRGYQKMQEVLGGLGARKLYNEAFGWQVYFSMHEEGEFDTRTVRMQHRFTKRIKAVDTNGDRITGDTLANATWRIISTPELYTQMYRQPMTSRIMQRVDAHTSVLMRTFPDANAVMRLRFVCMVVQVEDCVIDATPDTMGFVWKSDTRRRVTILSSILDPDKCFPRATTHTPDPAAEWMREGMSYLSFTEIDDENSIEIEYGGLMNVGSETASCTGLPFVCMNMGEALVRWEQLVTPARTLSITEK
ncbi:putative membrane protein, predicted efflux pump [Phytophthora cinnamomi]|uniref:putative membrane protein, predicted efflux pump n=1 Tax=Phytophthora cinnamomi TaxID=4785 RepID=UPI00355A0185|nr:putative membrane protein, predicted efflux pump [Phytophthora cinnamomi]